MPFTDAAEVLDAAGSESPEIGSESVPFTDWSPQSVVGAAIDAMHMPSFVLLVHSADGDLSLERFPTLADMRARLMALLANDVDVLPVLGYPLRISKPPLRYLTTPLGNVPLFDVPESLEFDDDLFIGRRYQELVAPDPDSGEQEAPASNQDADATDADEDIDMFGDGGRPGDDD